MDMSNEVKVKISDYRISQGPGRLITVGLGSCVGTLIYDERQKIAGLSHIMLPESLPFSHKEPLKSAKFADLALPEMVAEIKKIVPKARLKAKIVGGATMFDLPLQANQLSIGERNIQAVEKTLQKLGIPIIAREIGGNSGRTMIVDLETFATTVRVVNHPIVNI
ncbi:chemotaxis protein CheD [Enterococcus bulliens]